MALTFYWRCNATALDATFDYSAGATTMTLNGTASLSATAAKLGTNGVLNTDGLDYYYCASASIASTSEGSIGYWVKQVGALVTVGFPLGVGIEQASYTATDNWIFPRTASGGEVAIGIRNTTSGVQTVTTSSANMAADTWYFITISWKISTDSRRVRVYGADGTLLDALEDTATDLSAWEPTGLDRLFVGQRGSATSVVYVDNVFVGSAYDDADLFLANRDITSYTSYVTGTKYVKLLTEASAASKANIEGVVLNSTRDTVIGEFSGQTFEAALDAGEAKLLILASAITPNGSTLTTLDTPIIFAYNATESIIGPGSATVIEV